MSASSTVQFLQNDHGDYNPETNKGRGFRNDFAKDSIYMSLLQRNGRSLGQMLSMFDWTPDNDRWTKEYKKKDKDSLKLIRYRRRVSFCVGGWRELMEDFGRGDVSCMRDIRTPLVTSRSPLKAMKDEFDE